MKFDIDVNGILNVEAKEESADGKGKIVNLIIKNDEVSLSENEMEKLREKMINLLDKLGHNDEKNKSDYNIKGILKKYKDAFDKCNKIKAQKKKKDDDDDDDDDEEDDRIIYIQNYYTTLEDFIDKLDKNFDNETVLYKFYLYIKDLYQNYLEALKLDLERKIKSIFLKKLMNISIYLLIKIQDI